MLKLTDRPRTAVPSSSLSIESSGRTGSSCSGGRQGRSTPASGITQAYLFSFQEPSLRENPPTMVLSDESPEGVVFRFKGNQWAVATLIPGVALLWIVGKLHFAGQSQNWPLAVVGIFGILLVYSSIYSATADQWLAVSTCRKSITFHKKNLYGLVHWERLPQEFKCLRVGRAGKSSSWHIALICADGLELNLAENVFGAFTYERALDLATKVSDRTGINIESPSRAHQLPELR